MTDLSAKVKTSGLAKNKILVVLGVLGAVLISAVVFGVLTTDKDNKMGDSDNLVTYQDNARNTDQLLNDILAKRQVASATASESLPVVSPANSAPLDIVPPITKNNKDISPEEQAETEYNKKQLSRKYVSYGAKSLVYSSVSGSLGNGLNASSTVSGLKSAMPNSPQITDGLAATSDDHGSDSGISANVKAQKQFMQDSKTVNTGYLASSLNDAQSPYEVKAGSVIPAMMINGLNSDLPGQIVAQVRENVYDSSTRRYLLIPQGAKLVGLYDNNIIYGQERILVAWNRLIYPDGSSIDLKAMPGTDLEGYAGFYDEVDNKYWKIFGSSFIMGVITAAMQYSQNNTNANVQVGGIGVTTNTNPTVGQSLSGSLGQQLGQTGLAVTQKNMNVQPTLIVKPNYPFNIMLTADMILRPLPRR